MPQNEKENVCTTETKPVDPEVGDITQQTLRHLTPDTT